jgi:hypothetical protein
LAAVPQHAPSVFASLAVPQQGPAVEAAEGAEATDTADAADATGAAALTVAFPDSVAPVFAAGLPQHPLPAAGWNASAGSPWNPPTGAVPVFFSLMSLLLRRGWAARSADREAHRGGLKVLREAGLIEGERRGTWVYYRAIPERMSALAALLVVAG